MAPIPTGLTFERWASAVTENLAWRGVPSPVGMRWRDWAQRVKETDATGDVPNPDPFLTWQEWAEYSMESL